MGSRDPGSLGWAWHKYTADQDLGESDRYKTNKIKILNLKIFQNLLVLALSSLTIFRPFILLFIHVCFFQHPGWPGIWLLASYFISSLYALTLHPCFTPEFSISHEVSGAFFSELPLLHFCELRPCPPRSAPPLAPLVVAQVSNLNKHWGYKSSFHLCPIHCWQSANPAKYQNFNCDAKSPC